MTSDQQCLFRNDNKGISNTEKQWTKDGLSENKRFAHQKATQGVKRQPMEWKEVFENSPSNKEISKAYMHS